MANPAEELVDVIDEGGKTVAVVTRGELRARCLPHRCVYVLVFNRRGELLIHQRTATKDIYPSYWDVAVGGVLAAGESFDRGAVRECREELGVDVVVESLFPFRYEDPRTVVQAWVYRAVHDGPFQFQPEEVVQGDFAVLDELAALFAQRPFCPDGLEVWRQFQSRAGGNPHVSG